MLRRLVYLMAFVLVGMSLLVAVAFQELRLGFTSLAAAIAFGCWWVARRLPARPVSMLELRAAAVMTFVLGVAVAVIIPSTRNCPVHPVPQGGFAGFPGGCVVDHHTVLRLCAVLVGAALSVALTAAARRRTRTLSVAV
jgi:hypothetical protein